VVGVALPSPVEVPAWAKTKCRWTNALVRNRIVVAGEDCECFFFCHLRSERRCQLLDVSFFSSVAMITSLKR
jgi:hypothetical protein